jgi:flagellar hook-associated protein 3 FlgL
MINSLSPAAQLFLSNLNRIEQQLSQASRQIGSGRKVNVASDDPGNLASLLQLRADQQQNQQIQSNLTLAQTNAQAADSALAGAATLMDTAVRLATQGANATETANTRLSIAAQVQPILEEMVSYSQTQVQGRYIFSGDQGESPTYQMDLAAQAGVDQLANPAATQQIQNPAGGSFAASQTAGQIFDDVNEDGTPAADNVFAALTKLLTALKNNDAPGIANCIGNLHQASDHLNNADLFYGTVENRIQNATAFATSYDIQLKTEISGIQDVDVAQAATQLTQASTQLQAALQAQGKMPTTTLFNYLG